MNKKTASALWQDYLFLTKEMRIFLDKQDYELFYDLLEQRARLQDVLEETPDQGYKSSPEGQRLHGEIEQNNQAILLGMQVQHSKAKRHHQVSEVYNQTGSNYAANRMDMKR
jgi:hypothetical protein